MPFNVHEKLNRKDHEDLKEIASFFAIFQAFVV